MGNKTIIELLGLEPTDENLTGAELLAKQKETFALINSALKSSFTDEQKAKMKVAKELEIATKKAKEEEQKKAIKNLQVNNLRAKVVLYRTIEHENGKTSNLTIAEFEPKLENAVGTFVKKTIAMDVIRDGEKAKSTNQHAEFRAWNLIQPDQTKQETETDVSIDLVVRCAKKGLLQKRVIPSVYANYLQGLEVGKVETFSTKGQRDVAKQKNHNKADKLQGKEVK